MKTKSYLVWGLSLALLLSFNACKPKESAYKAAYEAAQAREAQGPVEEITPVSKPTSNTSSDAVQKEKVTVVGNDEIRQFSVVVGSFINRTNAVSERDKMAGQGYKSFLAQNEKGMFRVIVATFSDKAGAVAERDRIKSRFYPQYQDAWILDNQ
jgi:cell division protein FtsN